MNGWNLPPGCREADIDVDQGVADFCIRCGRYYTIIDSEEENTGLCAQCEGEENE